MYSYGEVVDTLYQENHFIIDHLDLFFCLQQTILPQQFNNIKNLSLVWEVPFGFYLPPPSWWLPPLRPRYLAVTLGHDFRYAGASPFNAQLLDI